MSKKFFRTKQKMLRSLLVCSASFLFCSFCIVISAYASTEKHSADILDNPVPEDFLNLSEDKTILYGFKSTIRPIDINKKRYNTLIIPSSVVKIDDYAFFSIFDSESTEVRKVSFAKTSAASLEIIGAHAFSDCSGIETFDLPSCLKTIESHAFDGCLKLKNLSLTPNIETIGDYAFASCSSIGKITPPESLQYVGFRAFSRCDNLQIIELSHFTYIPQWLFNYNEIFAETGRSETLHNRIVNIDCLNTIESEWEDVLSERQLLPVGDTDYVISGHKIVPSECFSLDSKTHELKGFSDKWQDDYVFKYDTIILPTDAIKISDSAFDHKIQGGRFNLIIYANEIGKHAFDGCLGINWITFDGTQKIGESAFAGCQGIQTLEIPYSVDTIGSLAFQSCSQLHELKLSMTEYTEIGSAAFWLPQCLDLTSFVDGLNLSCWQMEVGATTIFSNPPEKGTILLDKSNSLQEQFRTDLKRLGLTNVDSKYGENYCWDFVYAGNYEFSDADFVFGMNKTTLYGLTLAAKQLKDESDILHINGRVKRIYKDAFCNVLTLDEEKKHYWSLELDDNLSVVEDRAFANCTGLYATHFVLPPSITKIGAQAFMNCYNFRGSFIPYNGYDPKGKYENLKYIGDSAFAGCTGFFSDWLSIPGLSYLGSNAFFGVPLKNVIFTTESKDLQYMGHSVFAGNSLLSSIDLSAVSYQDFIKWQCEPDSFLVNGVGSVNVVLSSGETLDDWTTLLRSYGLSSAWTVQIKP